MTGLPWRGQWKPEQKKEWEDKGTVSCQVPLKAVDQNTRHGKGGNCPKTQLKILESSLYILVDITQSLKEELEERSEETY